MSIERNESQLPRLSGMDIAAVLRMEAEAADIYWQMCHRRDSAEGDQLRDEPDIPADFDDNEDAWNDIARRERLSEACYE